MSNEEITSHNIPDLLKQISIPVVTGLFFQTMYNIVDTFYAGYISTQAVAAISLSFVFVYILIGIGHGLGSALTSLIGNFQGRKKNFLASLFAHKGMLFIPLVGLFCSVLGYFIAPYVFMFLGAQDSYLSLALEYINIILLGNVFFMINFACNAVLNASGDTKTYRNSLFFGFFANIALNPIFMYGFLFIPEMGLAGIAFSTIFVQVLVMSYLLKKVIDKKIISLKNLKMFLPDKRIYKEFLQQGLPASLNIVIMGLGAVLLMHFISDYGYKAVAGYGIAYRIEAIVIMPALGLSTAVLIIISNNFGAKKYRRVFETLNTALKYGFYFCLGGAVFIFFCAETLIKYFDTDATVVQFGLTYIIIQIWVFFALVSLYICVSTLQAIKKPRMIFYIGLYRQIFAHVFVAGLVVKYLELDIKFLWFGILVMVYSAAIYLYFYTKKTLERTTQLKY